MPLSLAVSDGIQYLYQTSACCEGPFSLGYSLMRPMAFHRLLGKGKRDIIMYRIGILSFFFFLPYYH